MHRRRLDSALIPMLLRVPIGNMREKDKRRPHRCQKQTERHRAQRCQADLGSGGGR